MVCRMGVRPLAGPDGMASCAQASGCQYMDIPPLTAAVVPVMKALSSLA
jgi:hypothetical protein